MGNNLSVSSIKSLIFQDLKIHVAFPFFDVDLRYGTTACCVVDAEWLDTLKSAASEIRDEDDLREHLAQQIIHQYSTRSAIAGGVTSLPAGTKYSDIRLLDDTLLHCSKVSFAGKQVSPPLCILKLQKEPWRVDSTIGEVNVKGTFRLGDAVVTVPAGTFTCKTVSLQSEETEGEKMVLEYWFDAKVGLVKQHAQVGNINSTIELESYDLK